MKDETLNMKLRVLVVCSANSGKIVPYIAEQVEAIQKQGLDVEFFLIKEKGLLGYLRARRSLLNRIAEFQPDIIHAHYGLSGLLSNLQHEIPVVSTYHGSDINNPKIRIFSKFSIKLSKYNIFVAQKLIEIGKPMGNSTLLPCGVDLNLFKPQDKTAARKSLGLDLQKKYVLFAGSFANMVKNYPLAKSSVKLLSNVELLELKGYSRSQVVLLMNAVDACLMCSFSEGSPQFIKEALACNCPIVSTAVGDVPNMLRNIDGCYIVNANEVDIANALNIILGKNYRTKSENNVAVYDNEIIATKLVSIYKQVLNIHD